MNRNKSVIMRDDSPLPRSSRRSLATRASHARAVFVLALGAVLCLFPHVANADAARVKFLSDKLKSDDFRVRTNAVLALGATDDDAAVSPLCSALSDSSEVVRQASAVAMKRLNRSSSVMCLQNRASIETSSKVKVEIARAVEAIGGGSEGDSDPDAIKENPSAKYYVALSSIGNSTTRTQTEVDAIVRRAMKQKLESSGTIQLAPPKETPTAARATLSKRKMNGFYLAVAVDRFDYSNGNLRVKVKVGVFSYPNKSLIGNFDRGATKEGVRNPDKSSEDALLEYAAERVAEEFSQNASAFL